MTRRSDKDEKQAAAAAPAPQLLPAKKAQFFAALKAVEVPQGAPGIYVKLYNDQFIAQRLASRSKSNPPIYNNTPTDSDNSQATEICEWNNQPFAAAASAVAASPTTPILANSDWDGESMADGASDVSPSAQTTDEDTEADDDADFAEHTAGLFASKTGTVAAAAADAKTASASRAYRTMSAVTPHSFTAHMAPAARAASSGDNKKRKKENAPIDYKIPGLGNSSA